MPNIPPMITHTPDAQPLYASATPLPSGVFSGATWSANTPGTDASFYLLSVPNSGITSSSVIHAGVQDGTYADTNNCWMMKATPSSNAITFFLYGQPATTASFKVSWSVVKF